MRVSEHAYTGKERAASPGLKLSDGIAGCLLVRTVAGSCCPGVWPYLWITLIEVKHKYRKMFKHKYTTRILNLMYLDQEILPAPENSPLGFLLVIACPSE